MSSPFAYWSAFTLANALHLLLILLLALAANRMLRRATKSLVKRASTASRVAQAREEQTKSLANRLYSILSKIVWLIALLTALPEVGVNPLPAALLLAAIAFGFAVAGQKLLRDVIAGFHIVLEDQFGVGDTIHVAGVSGRVEQITLRRSVIRDAKGALVTLANGEIRAVSNLSRDWSQAFVDVSLPPDLPLDAPLQALERASAELRGDPAWSQTIVDGPRVLGLQSLDRTASRVRIQLRTAPTRQDEVSRELRRRIQIEFQKQGIPLSNAQRVEPGSPLPAGENIQPGGAA
jgi:moderate conductance mechanosensitive channel